jgi:Na+-transporting NADH:ubiquinone oxidoreductase subunit NqrF
LFASRERKQQSRAFHAHAEAMFQEADRLVETRQHQRLNGTQPGLSDRRFRELCSHYLHGVPANDTIDIFLDKAEGFGVQEDVTAPMIMVSAGTGFAPMRAFLFERLALKRRGGALGPALVFNSIRSSAMDLLYRDELAMFQDEGVLDGVHFAVSRDPRRAAAIRAAQAARACRHGLGANEPRRLRVHLRFGRDAR